jgi:hypothetical protein
MQKFGSSYRLPSLSLMFRPTPQPLNPPHQAGKQPYYSNFHGGANAAQPQTEDRMQ